MLRQKKKYEYVVEKLIDITKENGCKIARNDENSFSMLVPFDYEKYKDYYAFSLYRHNSEKDDFKIDGNIFVCIPLRDDVEIIYNSLPIFEANPTAIGSCYRTILPNDNNLTMFIYDLKYNQLAVPIYFGSNIIGNFIFNLNTAIINPSQNGLAVYAYYQGEDVYSTLDDLVGEGQYEDTIFNYFRHGIYNGGPVDNLVISLYGIKRHYLE